MIAYTFFSTLFVYYWRILSHNDFLCRIHTSFVKQEGISVLMENDIKEDEKGGII
ncbi:hypothetical protein B4110_3245 [Parageobacillus toebii]|uniref:Uncharacterized protein n=1 Tax=Parageobacillus toebii TaxID=153151 RepID=A0A150MG72_9BACL|nr:hypothetical protein B4110_3245 [Parageobacillus toebii]